MFMASVSSYVLVYLIFAHFMVIIIADMGHGNADVRRGEPDP